MSNSFKSQIESDIAEYKESHPNIPNIHKDEWAFNYWVLDKLFFEDEEIIESKIIDYSDYGTDAYEFYEDTKDVYLIQNKYYSDDSIISADYVKNDFLIRTITALENGTYKKAPELQSFFNKYKDDSDFTVYLQLFVTNNRHCIEADEYIKEFNLKHPKYRAKIFYLDNIEERYYNEVKEIKKNLKVTINSIDTLLDLYLLYKRAEEEKSKKSDSRAPIPYYLIDCFARYECKERTAKRILPELSSNDKIEYIIRLYTAVTKAYTKEYFAKNNVDYNKMIKQPIKYDILDNQRDILSEVI